MPRGVVAYSSGNHGQAVAIAAESLGTSATIVMPADAPALKVAATRAHGGRIVTYDRATEDREAIAQRIAKEAGASVVPPYDHPWTIAGQGTVALELLDEIPDLDALVIPIGGGGLISGSSIAAHAIRPGIRIFGVEPEHGNDTLLSLRAGERIGIPLPETIADGLRAGKPGALTFPIVQKHVEDIVLVSDPEIRDAMKFLLMRMKILVEPSGAASAAAVMCGKLPRGIRSWASSSPAATSISNAVLNRAREQGQSPVSSRKQLSNARSTRSSVNTNGSFSKWIRSMACERMSRGWQRRNGRRALR